jgi:hypothetical protein
MSWKKKFFLIIVAALTAFLIVNGPLRYMSLLFLGGSFSYQTKAAVVASTWFLLPVIFCSYRVFCVLTARNRFYGYTFSGGADTAIAQCSYFVPYSLFGNIPFRIHLFSKNFGVTIGYFVIVIVFMLLVETKAGAGIVHLLSCADKRGGYGSDEKVTEPYNANWDRVNTKDMFFVFCFLILTLGGLFFAMMLVARDYRSAILCALGLVLLISYLWFSRKHFYWVRGMSLEIRGMIDAGREEEMSALKSRLSRQLGLVKLSLACVPVVMAAGVYAAVLM